MAFAITSVRQLPAPHGNDKANDKDTSSDMSIRLENLVEAAKIIALRVYNAAMYALCASVYVASFQSYAKAGENADDYWEGTTNGGGSLKLRLHRIANPHYVDEALEKIADGKKKDKADPASKPHKEKQKKHAEKKGNDASPGIVSKVGSTFDLVVGGVKSLVDTGIDVAGGVGEFFVGNATNRSTLVRRLNAAFGNRKKQYEKVRWLTLNSCGNDPFVWNAFEEKMNKVLADAVKYGGTAYNRLADKFTEAEIATKFDALVQDQIAQLVKEMDGASRDYLKAVKRGVLERYFDTLIQNFGLTRNNTLLQRYLWLDSTLNIQNSVRDNLDAVEEFRSHWLEQRSFADISATQQAIMEPIVVELRELKGEEKRLVDLDEQVDWATINPFNSFLQAAIRVATDKFQALNVGQGGGKHSPFALNFAAAADPMIRGLAKELNRLNAADVENAERARDRVVNAIHSWSPNRVMEFLSKAGASLRGAPGAVSGWMGSKSPEWLVTGGSFVGSVLMVPFKVTLWAAGFFGTDETTSLVGGVSEFGTTLSRKAVHIVVTAGIAAGLISALASVNSIVPESLIPNTFADLAAVSLAAGAWYQLPKFRSKVLWMSFGVYSLVNYLPFVGSSVTDLFFQSMSMLFYTVRGLIRLGAGHWQHIIWGVGGLYALDVLKSKASPIGKVISVASGALSGVGAGFKFLKKKVYS